jgi:SP family facilitated glucose transporter-like MFS transporter 3
MTVSRDNLLNGDEENQCPSKVSWCHSKEENNGNLQNPIQLSGRQPSGIPNTKKLSNSMRSNGDGTVAIFTGSGNLYTEIPFAAIHGMQTKRESYAENREICQQGDTKPAPSFVEQHSITRPLVIATIAAAASQWLVGYNVVLLNTLEKFVFPGHNTTAWAAAVGALAIGAPLGAIFGGTISDLYGRRMTLVLDAIIFLVGGLIQTFAPNLFVLICARFVIGIASGLATVLTPIYLGELAPPSLRGALGTTNHFALVIGILCADLLSFKFATESGSRVMFSITAFVAAAQLLIAPFVAESPRWLLQRNPRDPSARETLQNLRGCSPDEVEDELKPYLIANNLQSKREKSQVALISEMLADLKVRRLFLACVGLHLAQQFCGINVVFYYSTSFFEGFIDRPLVGTTFIGAVNVVFTYVALVLMDSCKRKSLLLWSIGGMIVANLVLVLSQVGIFHNYVAVGAVNAYVAFYEIGMGPIPWLVIAEMFEMQYVAVTMSFCAQLSWIVNSFAGMLFPIMHQALGKYTFVPFGVSLVISFVFSWLFVPETYGRTPADIVADSPEKIVNPGELKEYIRWRERHTSPRKSAKTLGDDKKWQERQTPRSTDQS